MSEVLEDLPPSASGEVKRSFGLIDPEREREFRLGEIYSELYNTLLEVPEDTEATVDDKNMVLLKHEYAVASVQYQAGHRNVNGVNIYLNRALSLFRGPNGILYGEVHFYYDVWRQPDVPVQNKELIETVEPLSTDNLAKLKSFSAAASQKIE